MNEKSIPGWTININEISNGVFKVTLNDAFGRKAEVIDNATDETIERAVSDAFDIEKQVSKNWNLFLYDLSNQILDDTDIENREYKDKAFGSWFIEKQDKRLIYDGKDSELILQTRSECNWTNIDGIKRDDLKYSNFVRQINKLK
ncbi:MAG: hypothetical protein WKF66_02045 [Pedobacter sp.]